jgi:hypothetical protein
MVGCVYAENGQLWARFPLNQGLLICNQECTQVFPAQKTIDDILRAKIGSPVLVSFPKGILTQKGLAVMQKYLFTKVDGGVLYKLTLVDLSRVKMAS